MKHQSRKASVNCLQSSSQTRLLETQKLPPSNELLNSLSAKKSKTPGRYRPSTGMQISERTQAITDQLRETVFKLTREEDEQPRKLKSAIKGVLQESSCNQDNFRTVFPESPSIKSSQTPTVPTVSAKMFQQQPSPEKLSVKPTPAKQALTFSPSQDQKKRLKQKENHTVERLAHDFFKTALGDTNCDELEKVQLQQAISALSERLLLFQNLDEERIALQNNLKASEKARIDLQKVLSETSEKTKHELSRLEQYQEIML